MRNREVEVLAPAGSYDCFRAAISAGADAVYAGGSRFGARAYADNFSEEELIRAIEEAHLFGKKLYLTVNTLLKDNEIKELSGYLSPLYEKGLDAVIVQDVGVLEYIKSEFPELDIHASTQMTITGYPGAAFFEKAGAVRVVPARELSLAEIREIREHTDLEIECFVHGALCYSYSGQCLLSSVIGGRSGNRGRCAQPCRQPYRIRTAEGTGRPCYPLSLKDLCTIDLIPELIDAGIDSFKIEGRMKRAEYVAGVTDAYRRRIDGYLACPEKKTPVPPQDRRLLASLYVRTDQGSGYLKKHNGREMVTLEKPGYAGCDEGLLEEIRGRLLERSMELPVTLSAVLETGKPFCLTAQSGGRSVRMEGETVQQAQKRPMGEEEIRKQLLRTGGSGFAAEKIDISIKGEVFLPVKSINELRRSVLEKLRADRIAACRDGRKMVKNGELGPSAADALAQRPCLWKQPELSACVQTLPQLEACLKAGVSRIYVPSSAVTQEVRRRLEEGKKEEHFPEIFLALPVIFRAETRNRLEQERTLLNSGLFSGVQTASPSGLVWLSENGWRGKTALDHRIYIWNRQSWEFWREDMDTYCAPLELNGRDIRALPAPGPGEKGRKEILVYGRIPMMVTANCIRKTEGRCLRDVPEEKRTERRGREGSSAGELFLIDRYQTAFPVITDCRFCYNLICNSVPLSLHGFLGEMAESKAAFIRLDFLEESGRETEKILRLFEEGLSGKPVRADYDFTTGHYRKGAQ